MTSDTPECVTEQLSLDLAERCPECGSQRHSDCRDWYDPEMVKPARSVADALSATIAHVIETHGWDGAVQRMPGLRLWGQQPPADWRPTEAELQLLKLPEPENQRRGRKG
jgi:hypothetical protein